MRNLPDDGYAKEFLTDIIAFREKLLDEVQYKHWLLMRVNELIERNQLSILNEGNFWLKRRPGQYRYPFLRISENGEFECLLPEAVTKVLVGENNLPFCDFTVKVTKEYEQWDLVILKEYGDALKLPAEGQKLVPPFYCACTIIRAEDFSYKSCKELQHYVNKRRYRQIGEVCTFLCGGMALEPSGYLMELQLPIE